MSMSQQPELSREVVANELTVVNYLRQHPDFFSSHKGLLGELAIPHGAGGAVSLVERQVAALREQNRELKNQLQALVQVARENDRLSERTQRLTLSLLETASLNHVFDALHLSLHQDFNADIVSLTLFHTPVAPLPASDAGPLDLLQLDPGGEEAKEFEHIFKGGRPLCGHLRRPLREYLFRQRMEDVASAVALSLPGGGATGCMGILGIGSGAPQRYHASMGTAFLRHMGEIIGRTLRRHLSLV